MVLTKYTGSTNMDGSEDSLFKIVGTTMKHFASYVYLKALQAGESIRLRVYNKVDDVSYWKLDGDVTDSVGGNNGTITPVGSWQSQWKFDGNVLDSIGSNNGTITYHANLKALYKFDNTINDSTSGAHNLTLAAGTTTYVTGQEGQAISFDGSTYYTANSAVIVSGTGDRTVSFWVKTPSTFTTNTYMFSWGAITNNNMFGMEWTSTASTSTALFVGISNNTATNTVFQPNTWYFITITLGSTGTRLTLYVNGVLDKQATVTTLNTTSSSLFLGALVNASDFLQSGTLIDEFRIYSIEATQAQVSALYMNGKFAQSHTFDGNASTTGGESISMGNPSNLQFALASTFTISTWFKSTTNSLTQAIFYKYSTGPAGYGFFINSSGFVKFFMRGSTSGTLQVGANTNVCDGNWHMLTVSYNGGSAPSSFKIYIDGVSQSLSTDSNNLVGTIGNTVNVTVGTDGNSQGTNAICQLDEMRVYNAVLTDSQVLGLYNYTGSNYVTPLPVGNALSLDGSSYVTVTNQTPYNFERTNSFSMAFWIKSSAASGANQIILSKRTSGAGNAGYQIAINAATTGIQIRLINTGATNEINVTNTTTLTDGNWHNVVITYSGTSLASGVAYYLDGVNQSLTTTTNNLSASIQNTVNLVFGAISAGNILTGLLDEVQIFNYVVSSAEINAINAGRFANTHPIGLWHFDGDLYDYSGQGSTGNPTGTMTYVTGALSGSYNVPNTHFNFDGSEVVDCGLASNLNFERTDSFSVSFWMKASLQGSFQAMVAKFQGVATGWAVYQNGGANAIAFELANVNNVNDLVVTGGNPFDNLWHHIVCTYSGGSVPSSIAIYQDGVSQTTSTTRNGLTGSIKSSAHVSLGALDTSGTSILTGEIDDVRVYNRALSSAEVSDLYTYPDSAMKQMIYDRTYSGVKSDAVYIPFLQGNDYMVTCQQLSGTNRIISWEREESQ